MASFATPAIKLFLEQAGESCVLAEVLMTVDGGVFELRHVADREVPASTLKSVNPRQARQVAQNTEAGAFRPLKSAPTLARGWRVSVRDAEELDYALNQIYPNAIADWYAVKQGCPPITDYRSFTNRQSGMYRITTFLSDGQAGEAIRACCDVKLCLKQRLWSVEGLPPDPPNLKSVIPCLEMCAMMLEFARRKARLEQEEKRSISLSLGELQTLRHALDRLFMSSDASLREGETGDPSNRRRVLMLQQKIEAMTPSPAPEAAKE